MGKYTKTIGCKVESWVYYKIKNKTNSPSEYLRNLIYNDLNKEKNSLKSVVNHVVNEKKLKINHLVLMTKLMRF